MKITNISTDDFEYNEHVEGLCDTRHCKFCRIEEVEQSKKTKKNKPKPKNES